MAVLKVMRLGHPILREVSGSVGNEEILTPKIQQLIDDLVETMHDHEGVGIAAPQVGVGQQIAVCEVKKNLRYPQAPEIPLTVLINPKISERSHEMKEDWEGCLSIPDLRGNVPRHVSLVCEAMDREGRPFRLEADGFFARVIQHELDHLCGKVYPDRMPDLRTLTHLDEFHLFWEE